MSMPDKPAHEWESPASRKASANGEVGQHPIPSDGNGPAPGETHPQEGENAPRAGEGVLELGEHFRDLVEGLGVLVGVKEAA